MWPPPSSFDDYISPAEEKHHVQIPLASRSRIFGLAHIGRSWSGICWTPAGIGCGSDPLSTHPGIAGSGCPAELHELSLTAGRNTVGCDSCDTVRLRSSCLAECVVEVNSRVQFITLFFIRIGNMILCEMLSQHVNGKNHRSVRDINQNRNTT